MLLAVILQLLLFTTKALILVIFILITLIAIVAILGKAKEKLAGRIKIKNLNKKYSETKDELLAEILSKDEYKKFQKEQKIAAKNLKQNPPAINAKRVFVLNFDGDIKASAVSALREEVTAVLNIATPHDEVVVKLESAGGMVHAYGLAAMQLQRIRDKNILLTVIVDKVAASGGYLMACVANKIIAAPFAIIGSIGVIIQMPNFNRLLKNKNIDFEQLTAGDFKRTLTMFGENSEEGREKMRQEITEIHELFKNQIKQHRPTLDIQKVATGEHWLGSQAKDLYLVDALNTSDDYLMTACQTASVFELSSQVKKSFLQKLTASAHLFKKDFWLQGNSYY
jgi:serine protease SohB